VIRISLVLFTVILAVSIPEFDLLTSFIGGLFATALAYIIPALIHLKIFPGNKWYVIVKDVLIILWGVTASILCTSVTIYEMVKRLIDRYS